MSGSATTRKPRFAARFLPSRATPPSPVPDTGSILAALPVATVVLDAENRVRSANNAAEQFFGLSFSSLSGMSLAEMLPPDNRLFSLLDQVRRFDARVSDHDLTLESPRLHRRGVTAHAAPVPEMAGSVVLMLEDGSTAQMLDRQLNFRGAARGASAMAAMLAHEVKNPLSGIRGAAQLLEQAASEPDRELCQLIQDEADRIRGLVDRFDMFSDRPIEKAAVNIHQVLDHVKRIAATGFGAHLRIVEEYDPSLPMVWGNRDQLVQILLNLVKNAAEAVDPTNGELVLTTAYRHGVRIAVPGSQERVHLPLEVAVRDNGPGIEESVRPTLFEPFVTTKRGGQGLGLALVAKLVADQGGLIECDSRPGRTVFRMSLAAPPPGADAGAAQ
ncbi:two-component system sensor histidine kinase NtrB [Plastoroseomonas hellenica]|uniref:histidine kinase n=1 Tax=Plastoroseomonas hellenica TaxID=2687306 RepID=A0ABS5EUY5_9PROT|nr:ATP-binding protein [Plastoroseomonas hellenica]MBR0644300.1 PAS domain-containing protein [Plastoroseomonas hellenica]MBR0664112.1 PAS domain-containing protein [Plastoroseomonas hellenica]